MLVMTGADMLHLSAAAAAAAVAVVPIQEELDACSC
jgi:hypothetical protein